MNHVDAAGELLDKAGTQFDPSIVEIFIRKVLRIPPNEPHDRS
jgi:HD-GYP domain-containing protein (c-di-GMP phosphodiesterase class II)